MLAGHIGNTLVLNHKAIHEGFVKSLNLRIILWSSYSPAKTPIGIMGRKIKALQKNIHLEFFNILLAEPQDVILMKIFVI